MLTDEDDANCEFFADQSRRTHGFSSERAKVPTAWLGVAIGTGVVVAIVAAPHIKRIWSERVKPASIKLRGKLSTRKSASAA